MNHSHSSDGENTGEVHSTPLSLLDRATRRLEAAGCAPPRRTAEWMLAEVLEASRAWLYAHADRLVDPDAARRFEAMVERRVQGEPLQHVLGHTSFYGLRIQVSSDVMVPRPETETVVERALDSLGDADAPRLLDVGTGSGCIALALKHERPNAAVHACDVSPDALAVARANADALGLDVQFTQEDVLADTVPETLPSSLDVLVSNPPYIPDEEAGALPPVVREYDPDLSLFAGEDPLRFYRALLPWASALCRPGGAVVCEVHAEYAGEVAALFRRGGLRAVRLQDDLSGRPRVVQGRRSGERV